jgi:RND superfamily putative drug exporter
VSSLLYRLGRTCVRRRRRVVLGWFLAVVLLAVAGSAAGGAFHDRFDIPGVESQQAVDLLRASFPAQAGSTAQVVFHATRGDLRDPAAAKAVGAALRRIARLDDVAFVPSELADGALSDDATIGLATVRYDAGSFDLGKGTLADLERAGAIHGAPVTVDYGGEVPQFAARPQTGPAEVVGLLLAVLILLFAFGSLIAMGLPIGTALFGLAAGMTLIRFISALIDVPSSAEAIASMVGIGVGIDYALFIITRHRAGLHRGLTVEDAAGRAIATAGQAVLIAGTTVVIAICGLAVAGIPLVTFMGLGAALVVAVMVIASLTLLPALMGFAGHAIDRFGIPGMKAKVEAGARDEHGRYHGWARWSHHVTRHPLAYLLGSLVILLALALPARDLRLGQTDASQNPTSSTLRRSYDLLAAGFGPGFNGPLVVAVDLRGARAGSAERIVAAIEGDPGVEDVAPPVRGPRGGAAVVQVEPTTAPQDEATGELVHRLRDRVLPAALRGTGAKAYVGGQTAAFIDLSERVGARLPWFIGAVVGMSFVLLLIVFRSILVPLKAALMNVLSIAAAYGVLVAVFQKGWGASLFGVHESLPIVSFIPMFMFAILFGLSMDYEVFLLSRIREEYLVTRDNTESIVVGITTTARVITSAALIMMAVFLAFCLSSEPMLKMAGLGLATAVLIDATLVRMVLVPSTMRLLGDANWWLPRWLDRIVPNLDVEGEAQLPQEELEARPPVLVGTAGR